MVINKHVTLFILDWDDTLFPTNWVMKNGINLMSANTRDQYTIYFQELDRILSKVLKTLISMGKVVIVTNALPEWINISSAVLPQTYNLLKKVKKVSARGSYRHLSNKMTDWKIMAFKDVLEDEFDKMSSMNVISIGDAEYEYHALIALYSKHGNKTSNTIQNKYFKSIRFMKDPTHDILITQLESLNDEIPKIWTKNTHLDLKFDHYSNVKKKKRC